MTERPSATLDYRLQKAQYNRSPTRRTAMIFVTDASGHCIHVSSNWLDLTGQQVADALGMGWLDRIHVDDREAVTRTVEDATRAGAEYSVRYRLLRPDDTSRWVVKGGVPSFGMEDKSFIGYLGTITEIAMGATDTITAYGNVGRFVPPAPHPATMLSCDLDLVADYLIMAHSLIEGDGGKEALSDVRVALFKIGRALATRTKESLRTVN